MHDPPPCRGYFTPYMGVKTTYEAFREFRMETTRAPMGTRGRMYAPQRVLSTLLLIQAACGERGTLCSDDCRYRHDGECDDSGPDSESSTCALGTDCRDCGPRREADLGAFLCSDKCRTRRDGQCDDGGPGSQFKTCDFGTDCADCGPRATGARCGENNKLAICGHGCMFGRDGHCDDGGPGSKFDSCSLGSDCDDCGSRMQPCGKTEESDSYDDFEMPVSSPPSPMSCVGDGRPTCDMKVCSVKMHTDMCKQCKCSGCSFCHIPSNMVTVAPPVKMVSPPPPSPPPPPWAFTCDMLEGRHNIRLATPPNWCYALSASSCVNAFTYDWHSSGTPELNICRLDASKCVPAFVPAHLYGNNVCENEAFQLPPTAPLLSPPPPSPPSPAPPPAPLPCVPLSARCGGDGPEGQWECCQPRTSADIVKCFKKDETHSQCRTECVRGWACDTTTSIAAEAHAHATSGETEARPSSKVDEDAASTSTATGQDTAQLKLSKPSGSLVPDPCKACRIVDPSGIGTAWRAIMSPKFGNGCYTHGSAMAVFNANGGVWPGMPEFTANSIPSGMKANPSRCYQLPDGLECFKSPDHTCSTDTESNPTSRGEATPIPADSFSISTPFLSFSARIPPSAVALLGVFMLLWIVCRSPCSRRDSRRKSTRDHEKVPLEEPGVEEPGMEEEPMGYDIDDSEESHMLKSPMTCQIVSL